jgi:D-amino peptidase
LSDDSKVFISVDMEGISGIVNGNHTGRDALDYGKGRALMVGDVNAAVEGILAKGVGEVVVSDGHGWMKNIQPEDLHPEAILVRGSPKPLTQMAGIDGSFDAAMFIGYHSKRGTLRGILSHTISGRVVDRVTINDLEVGETGINGAISGYYGVPLIFLSGDLAVTREAEELIPNIVTATVKEGITRVAAKCMSPEKARELISRKAGEALEKRNQIEPLVFEPPVTVEVRYSNAVMADAVEFMPSAERVDGRTMKFIQDDYLKAFGALRASIYIAGSV